MSSTRHSSPVRTRSRTSSTSNSSNQIPAAPVVQAPPVVPSQSTSLLGSLNRSRNNGQPFTRPKTFPSFSSERSSEVILNFEGRNHQKWIKSLELIIIREYPDFSSIIKSGQYPILEAPVRPTLAPNEYVSPFVLSDYQQDRLAYMDKAEDYRLMKISLYGRILQLLSEQSIDVMSGHANFTAVTEAALKDPLALLTIIRETHVGIKNPGVKYELVSKAKLEYGNLKQYPNESLLDYKERFKQCIQKLLDYGAPAENEEFHVFRFIHSLDVRRFELVINDYNYHARNNMENPKTIESAYLKAKDQEVRPSKHVKDRRDQSSNPTEPTLIQSVALVTSSDKGKRRNNNNNKNNSRHKGQEDSNTVMDTTNPQTQSNTTTTTPLNKSRHSGAKKKLNERCEECKHKPHPCGNCKVATAMRYLLAAVTENPDATINYGCTAYVEPTLVCRATVDSSGNIVHAHAVMSATHTSQNLVLLDNQATASIFNNHLLLTNIHKLPQPITFTGLAEKAPLVCRYGGYFLDGILVCYHPNASKNLLSGDQVADAGGMVDIKIHPDVRHGHMFFKGIKYEFLRTHGNIYSREFFPRFESANISIAENESKFTKRQVEESRRVREMFKNLAFPGTSAVIDALSRGTFSRVPFSPQQVVTAGKIYGQEPAVIKGKSHQEKSNIPVSFPVSLPEEFRMITLHIDLMYVNAYGFLLSIGTPINYTIVTFIGTTKKSRSSQNLLLHLKKHIHAYPTDKFEVKFILCDGEAGFLANREELNLMQISINPVGAGQHVPIVERKIETIKERCRTIIYSLPYKLSLIFIEPLVLYVVNRINMLPNKGTPPGCSPIELFTGQKVDFLYILRVGFGDYVEALNPNTDNSMASRTESCIALYPTGNNTGTYYLFNLTTRKIIRRSKFKVLMTPKFVIDFMDQLKDAEIRNITTDMFRYDPTEVLRPRPLDDSDAVQDPAQLAEGVNMERETTYETVPVNAETEQIDREIEAGPKDNDIEGVVIPSELEDKFPEVEELVHDTPNDQLIVSPLNPSAIDRPKRIIKPNSRYADHFISYVFHQAYNVSVAKSMRQDAVATIAAIESEIGQMLTKEVWTPIDPNSVPRDAEVIYSFIFLKWKYDTQGNPILLKARLVAMGNEQDPGNLTTDEISSPTANMSFVFAIAAIAAKEGAIVVSADVAGAFLNAPMTNYNIVMVLDQEVSKVLCNLDPSYKKYLDFRGRLKVQLRKAVYGCIQSSKLWYDTLTKCLISIGYQPNYFDPCILTKKVNNVTCTVVIYVDDLLITSLNRVLIDEVINKLIMDFKAITVKEGLQHNYLGMHFDFTENGAVNISMDARIKDILMQYPVTNTKQCPAIASLLEEVKGSPPLSIAERKTFHSVTAKLLYIAKRTRPDILLPVSFLTTKVQAPTKHDQKLLNRVLEYLKGSINLPLRLTCDVDVGVKLYVDASYGCHTDFKSHTGAVVTLGGGAIYANSSKQRINTKSSMEAEMIALSDMGSVGIWMRNFLISMGIVDDKALKIFQDNKSTIALIEKGVSTSNRTRHIGIRTFWLKDRIKNKEVQIIHVPTDLMIADGLTKGVTGNKFLRLRNLLMNQKC